MADRDVDVVDVKRLSLIDVSFEDDRLIETSPARPVGPQFSAVDRSLELLRSLDFDKEGETMASKPLESFEERANKTPENYHLRKSLAWDTAFFTNDGVLEPDELSSMIEDAEKKEKRTLPMILEETQRSTESISTLASDTLTFASLEAELFEDIRASIQKSSRTSYIQNSGIKAEQSLSEAHSQHYLEETYIASQDKLKVTPASKKSSLGMIRQGKTANQVPVPRRLSQSVGRGDSDSNSLPSKPPKPGMLRPITTSTKRESMGANRMKSEKNNIEGALGRGSSTPRVPVSSGTRSIVPRPSSVRSASTHSASVKTEKMTPPSRSTSDGKTGKPPVNLRNKIVDPGSRKLSSAGSSNVKTPPRSTPCLSAHLISATKLSSSISPASSWSSESSSSNSTVKQRSNGPRASPDPSSSEKTCDDGVIGQQLDGPNSHGSTCSTVRVKGVSTGGTLHLPNLMQPSGLRMPSPKIGFFDGVKSGRTPNTNRPSPQAVPRGLAKNGAEIATLEGSINKVKVAKIQSARSAKAIGTTKQSSDGSLKSLLAESSSSAEKVSGASRNVKRCSPGISSRGQSRLSPRYGSSNRLKAEEIKAKDIGVKICDDKGCPEVKPVSDTIDGGLETSKVMMDLVDEAGAGCPVKWENPAENGSVFEPSLCDQNESSRCLSKLSQSSSVAQAQIATDERQPFTAIDSFCNMDDSSDVLSN